MILNDKEIAKLSMQPDDYSDWYNNHLFNKKLVPFQTDLNRGKEIKTSLMIDPFVPNQVRTQMKKKSHANLTDLLSSSFDDKDRHPGVVKEKIVSYGLSSFGYDLRCGNKFKIFTNVNSTVIDPKNFDPTSFVEFEGDVCIIPPNSFVLCASLERIALPNDVTGIVLGKSTYARTGISCLATPLEAGWEGYVTLEFANTTPLPAKLYANEGCCQVIFFRGSSPCLTSYADRNGKYMNQVEGPVVAKV